MSDMKRSLSPAREVRKPKCCYPSPLMIALVLYPNAFRVPIWVRSSPIMRVMVVIHTSAATSRKNTGSTLETP